MTDVKDILKRRKLQGWGLLGAGVLLLIAGMILGRIFPGSVMNFKWVEGFGVLFIGWGMIALSRYLLVKGNPTKAKRAILDETDERSTAIRHQAGNAAFIFTFLASSFALIIYSAITRGQPTDAMWIYMAAVVIVPGVIYTGVLVWLQNR